MDDGGAMYESLDAAYQEWCAEPQEPKSRGLTFAEYLLQSRLHAIGFHLGLLSSVAEDILETLRAR